MTSDINSENLTYDTTSGATNVYLKFDIVHYSGSSIKKLLVYICKHILVTQVYVFSVCENLLPENEDIYTFKDRLALPLQVQIIA